MDNVMYVITFNVTDPPIAEDPLGAVEGSHVTRVVF